MSAAELLRRLRETPRDARAPVEEADEVIYRLGLRALGVPGLPESTTVGSVRVEFATGPVRAQETVIRQRHGLPVRFDKTMTRPMLGRGELLAILSIAESPVPGALDSAFSRWRAQALAAAGMLAAVLDERVVGEELFEDAILLREGVYIGGADVRSEVRSFLPFELNGADAHAIAQLRSVSVSESSAAARAARLYRRAAVEGPTADAYAMLWVAAECFSSHRGPSRKDIEAALREAGIDPDRLPLHVGILIDLRGKVQHLGLESDERLRLAFYEMEAVVRSLIRRELQIRGGWWPASDNPAGFAEPFDHAVATLLGRGESTWHKRRLPPAARPTPQNIPRRVPHARHDPRLSLDTALGDAGDLVANVLTDALEWQNPHGRVTLRIGSPAGAPGDVTAAVDAETIWLSAARLDGWDDPERPSVLVNLVWDLHALVASAVAQQEGVRSQDEGVALLEALGAWAQYRRLVTHGDFDPSLVTLPSGDDLASIGKLAGWAAAGDSRAKRSITSLEDGARRLADALIDRLHEHQPGAPTALLNAAGP